MRAAALGVLTLALAAATLVCVLLLRACTPPPPLPRGSSSVAGAHPPGRSPLPNPHRLELQVLGRDIVSGVVCHRGSKLPPRHGDRLEIETAGEAYLRLPEGGRREIVLQRRQWTWLAIHATREAGASTDAYRLVPPFEGRHRMTIDLGVPPTLHVFVLDATLASAAPRAPFALFRRKWDGSVQRLASLQTDDHGYASLTVAPGGYVVCASPAGPRESPPSTVPISIPGGSDALVTLVAPRPRRRIRLRLHVLADLRFGERPPKLFLRDLERGTLWPVPGTLSPGRLDVEHAVPAGAYRAEVLPIGAMRVTPDRLDVVRPDTFDLDVHRNPNSCRVTLAGIGRHELPVTVHPRLPGPVQAETAGLLFLGRHYWHERTQSVLVPLVPVRLIAFGRGRTWIAGRAVILSGQYTVSMLAATKLQIRWYVDRVPRTPRMVVAQGPDCVTVVPRPGLIELAGEARTVLLASVVVRRGRVRVRATGANSVWQREVRGASAVAELDTPELAGQPRPAPASRHRRR